MKEKFLFTFVFNISSNIIYIISSYLLVLHLEVILLGLWVFLNSIVNLGFLFIDIGFDILHYQYSGKNEFSNYFGTYFFLKSILLLLNLLISFLITTFLNLWNETIIIFILILLMSKVFSYYANTFLVHLRAKIKVFKAEIPSFLTVCLKSIFIIFLSVHISEFNNPILFLALNNFIFDFFFLIILIFLSKSEIKTMKPIRKVAENYIKDVKSLAIYSIILVIATYLGDIILNYSFGYEALANFSIINTFIIPVLLLISGSVITVYFSFFSKFFENNDITSIKSISRVLEKYFSILFLFIISLVYSIGREVFELFLPNYVGAIEILYIMIFIPYIVGISRHYPYILVSGKKQKLNAIISSINSILIIFLMIFLIPDKFLIFPGLNLGAIGYALAQTLPWILWTILNRYYVYKHFQIPLKGTIFIHIPLALVSFFVSFLIKQLFIMVKMNTLLIIVLIGLIQFFIFVCSLFLFKQLKKEDIKKFMDLFKYNIYKNSIKEEFKKKR